MLGRVSRASRISPCRHAVLRLAVQPSRVGKLFKYPVAPPTELQDIPVVKAKVDYRHMLSNLPKGSDFVHRGMAGFGEVESIAKEGAFGAGNYAKRPHSLDIPRFIHKPESCVLLSTSPDPHTVREYMVGYQLIQAKGAIASMCLPPVYIRPQTTRHVDIEAFQYYQKILNGEQEPGSFTRVEDIFDLAHGNNETTVILGATKKDDWRPRFDADLHSIVLVKGAGRILSSFTNADTVETATVTNPNFRKRIMSIEIFSTTSIGGTPLSQKYFGKMNERAQKLGLVAEGNRMLTIEDAVVLMNSSKYQAMVQNFKATAQTIILQGVPKHIPIGSPALIEYAVSLIEACPSKQPITSTGTESLHL